MEICEQATRGRGGLGELISVSKVDCSRTGSILRPISVGRQVSHRRRSSPARSAVGTRLESQRSDDHARGSFLRVLSRFWPTEAPGRARASRWPGFLTPGDAAFVAPPASRPCAILQPYPANPWIHSSCGRLRTAWAIVFSQKPKEIFISKRGVAR
jgi:hypothetical protein